MISTRVLRVYVNARGVYSEDESNELHRLSAEGWEVKTAVPHVRGNIEEIRTVAIDFILQRPAPDSRVQEQIRTEEAVAWAEEEAKQKALIAQEEGDAWVEQLRQLEVVHH